MWYINQPEENLPNKKGERNAYRYKDITEKQTELNRQSDRHLDIQTDRQTARQTDTDQRTEIMKTETQIRRDTNKDKLDPFQKKNALKNDLNLNLTLNLNQTIF